MSDVDKNGIRRAGDKKPVFDKETYAAVLKLAQRMPPAQMRGVVGIAKRYFDKMKMNSLEVDVMTLADHVDGILVQAKEELQGRAADARQSGNRREVESYLSESEATKWSEKFWANPPQIGANEVLTALDKAGHNTTDNRAPEGFVQGLVDAVAAKNQKLADLKQEKPEMGAPSVVCGDPKHVGSNDEFAPMQRNVLQRNHAGELEIKLQAHGGQPIVEGQFYQDLDASFELIEELAAQGKLEGVDLMSATKQFRTATCGACVSQKRQGERVINDVISELKAAVESLVASGKRDEAPASIAKILERKDFLTPKVKAALAAEFGTYAASGCSDQDRPSFMKRPFRRFSDIAAMFEKKRDGLLKKLSASAKADDEALAEFQAGRGKPRGQRPNKVARNDRDANWRKPMGRR